MTAEEQHIPDISATPAWQALARHHDQIRDKHLRELFDDDPARGTELTLTVGDLYIDYSKHRVTRETLKLLVDLADAQSWNSAATPCSPVCTSTPPRTARCCTPRCGSRAAPSSASTARTSSTDVHEVLDRMGDFTDRLRSGEWTGATGERINTVVNIGIGGSDLGPVMVYQALRHYADAGISAGSCPTSTRRTWCQARRTRPCHNAFHRRVEDVLHAGDADQRDRGPALAHRRARRRRGVQAFRRGVDQQEAGRRLRHRHRQHVRLLGLGRRPLLGGLGDRAVGDGGDRPGSFAEFLAGFHLVDEHFAPRRWRPNAAGAARPDRALVLQLLRRGVPRGAALLATICPGSPPTCSS